MRARHRTESGQNQLGPNESGNVIFLILIAVVLFAALTFAITMSGRNQGGDDINAEHARMAAARMTQNGVDIEGALMRMKTVRNIPDSQLSFETPALTGYQNPDCTTNQCHVFLPEGGGVSYNLVDPAWLQKSDSGQNHYGRWIITGTACVPGMGGGSDNSCNADPLNNELIVIIPWIIRDVCVEMNHKLDIPMVNKQPPQLIGSAWNANPEFVGAYVAGQTIIDSGGALYGKPEGCFEGNGTPPAGTYHYYRVVVAR